MKGQDVLLKRGMSDEWEPPPELFAQLNQEFRFDIDAAASDSNHLCSTFYTESRSALHQEWNASAPWPVAFMNPPYSQVGRFVEQAYNQARRGITVVGLLPVRADTAWFHKFIQGRAEVRFIRGRLKFCEGGVPSTNSAPFPSMVVIWRG